MDVPRFDDIARAAATGPRRGFFRRFVRGRDDFAPASRTDANGVAPVVSVQEADPCADLGPVCSYRVAKPGYQPQTNGCGPECGAGRFVPVPDSIWGVDFKTAGCDAHDICYATCNTPKSYCDLNFGNDLRNECIRVYGPPEFLLKGDDTFDCMVWADRYEWGVSTFGGTAYESGQHAACKCCEPGTLPCDNKVCCPLTALCVDGRCECPDCTELRNNACEPVECSDPCTECRDNSCQPKECGACQHCVDGACVDDGSCCAESGESCADTICCEGLTCTGGRCCGPGTKQCGEQCIPEDACCANLDCGSATSSCNCFPVPGTSDKTCGNWFYRVCTRNLDCSRFRDAKGNEYVSADVGLHPSRGCPDTGGSACVAQCGP